MVTRAGKDLLKNTIRSTDYHNKLIQEDEMWRQWELEKGLTMMVTDNCIRNRMRMDSFSASNQNNSKSVDAKKLQKQKEAARESRPGNYWSRKLMEAEDNDPDRWGHSGYRELYPEEFRSLPHSKIRSSSSTKSHSSQDRLSSKNRPHTHKKRKRKHKRVKRSKKKHKKQSDDEDESSRTSRNNRESSYSSEFAESPDVKHNVNENNDEESYSETLPCLSDVSARELARRREYLKRKLEEFSEESASTTSSSDEEANEVVSKKHKKSETPKTMNRKKIRSHVTIENRHVKNT